MLSSIPGIENLSPAVKYVIAFAIIFLLLALFALVLRRLTGGKLGVPNDRGRARQPRLGIVDVYDLDRQRQLILLRRDNVEHLLLVGGPNDVVVETNIVRVPGARIPAAGGADVVDRIEPPTERTAEIAAARPVIEPFPARTDKSRPESATSGAKDAAPKHAAELAPAASDTQSDEPARLPTANGAAAATSVRASKAPVRPVEPVRPSPPASPPARTPRSNLQANPSPPPAPATTPAPAPPTSEPAETAPPAANLSDMARQLEDALKRPEPAPAPEPPRVAPPAPRPAPARRPDSPPLLGAPGTSGFGTSGSMPNVSAPPPIPADPLPTIIVPPAGPPIVPPPAAPIAAPPMPAAFVPIPLPRPAEPKPASFPQDPSPATPAPPPPVANLPALAPSGPTSARDPFSIEDIEAEFARLLGRPLDRKEDKN